MHPRPQDVAMNHYLTRLHLIPIESGHGIITKQSEVERSCFQANLISQQIKLLRPVFAPGEGEPKPAAKKREELIDAEILVEGVDT